MSKSSASSGIYSGGFPANLSDLPLNELEKLAIQVRKAIEVKKQKNNATPEADLIQSINSTVLNVREKKRYETLVEKMEASQLSSAEQIEFVKLTQKDEKLRNKRLELLIHLAKIRNVTLSQLMDQMGLSMQANG
ncbi:MAG: hypothetical protein IT269_03280 [Saprospiraceae bacterium]|nr:hypothetical protein [Saprospiraceae bacterium]